MHCLLEGLAESLAREFLADIPLRDDVIWAPCCMPEIFPCKIRPSRDISLSAYRHVSDSVPVRCVIPVGAVSPAVPVAEIPVVECRHEIVKEVCRTASSGICQRRLGHDGIAFQHPAFRIKSGHRPCCHFPEKPVERAEGMAHPELHLRHMPRLVYCKHLLPRHCLGPGCFRGCNEVHTSRCPCHRAVRQGIVRVEDYRGLSPCHLPRDISGASRDRDTVFL